MNDYTRRNAAAISRGRVGMSLASVQPSFTIAAAESPDPTATQATSLATF